MDPAAPPPATSWYDRLEAWIERRAGPPWLFYVTVALVAAILFHLALWVTGYVAVGTLNLYVASGAAYLVIGYAGMHLLDLAAARAWTTIRPATRLDDAQADAFAHELTTMPAGPALAASGVAVIASIVFLVSQYGRPFDLQSSPVPFLLSVVVVTVGFVGTIGALYHSAHQLRLIARVHLFLGPIDPLHLEPLHAFAGITAATGILLLAIGYLAIPTNPFAFTNPSIVAITVIASVLAIACFVLPLAGMHDAILAEKRARQAEVSRLLNGVLARLHRRLEEEDVSDADAISKQLSSLLSEREVVDGAPTWPWAPQTLRGFSAAVVIPIGLWLVYRVLERTVVV